MNNYIKINYVPTVLEEPQPESSVSQWSVGIAMFAAFVIPFVLLFSSVRYRAAIHVAQQKLGIVAPAPAELQQDK